MDTWCQRTSGPIVPTVLSGSATCTRQPARPSRVRRRGGTCLDRVAADDLHSGADAGESVDGRGAVVPEGVSADAALSAGLFTLPMALRGSAATIRRSRGIL